MFSSGEKSTTASNIYNVSDVTMEFKLEGQELNKAKEFEEKHWSCGHPATGERFTYSFSRTGLGTITLIRCYCCKTEKDLTNMTLAKEC